MAFTYEVYELKDGRLVNNDSGPGSYRLTGGNQYANSYWSVEKVFWDKFFSGNVEQFAEAHSEDLGDKHHKHYIYRSDMNGGKDSMPKWEAELASQYHMSNGSIKYLVIQKPDMGYPGEGISSFYDKRKSYKNKLKVKQEQSRVNRIMNDDYFPFQVSDKPIKVEIKDNINLQTDKQEIKKEQTELAKSIAEIEVQLQLGGNMRIDGFMLVYLLSKDSIKSFRATSWNETESVSITEMNGMKFYMKVDSATGTATPWTGSIAELTTDTEWEVTL